MRPTFLGFEASKSALFASQKALDITGNNLANISSQGYTRQRVDQVSVRYNNYANKYFRGTSVALAGQGTNVIGIGQTRDKQLDNAFRQQCAEIGGYSQQSAMLTDIETALQEFDIGDEGNGYGLRSAVSELYNALQDFSTDASSATFASVAADSFSNMASTLNNMANGLNDVTAKYKSDLQFDCSSVNDYLADIASINKDIKDAIVTNGYTEEYGPNELLDQRNSLIDELSTYGELTVKYNSDGTVDISMGDHAAVTGTTADSLNYLERTDGTVNVSWKSDGKTTNTGSGVISSSVNILNGRGSSMTNATENATRGVLYYKDKLNEFTTKLIDICNNTIPDTVDANGNVTSYKKLFGAKHQDADGKFNVYEDMYATADNIAVSDNLDKSVNYLLSGDGDSDNKNLLTLVAKLSNTDFSFNGFTGTLEEFITDYSTKLGSDLNYANDRYDAAVTVGNTLNEHRDSVLGVSETEETTNMLAYNRAFQAASRMMTVMDDLLDVIINQMAV